MKNLKFKVNASEVANALNITDIKAKNSWTEIHIERGNSYITRVWNDGYSKAQVRVNITHVDYNNIPDNGIDIIDGNNELTKYFNLLKNFDVKEVVISNGKEGVKIYTVGIFKERIEKTFEEVYFKEQDQSDFGKTLATFNLDIEGMKKTRLVKDLTTLQKIKPKNYSQYVANVFCVNGKMIDNNTIEFASVDGYRLVLKRYNCDYQTDKKDINSFQISNCGIVSMIKVLRNSNSVENIEFKVIDKEGNDYNLQIDLTVKPNKNSKPKTVTIITSFDKNKKFFDYTQIMPDKNHEYQYSLEQKDLLNTLNNFKPYFNEDENKTVINEVVEDYLQFKVDGITKMMEINATDRRQNQKDKVKYGINGGYLLEAVSDLEGKISLGYTDSCSPIMVRDTSGKNEHLILPLRIAC